MSKAFDPDDPPDPDAPEIPLEPKDAATLILVRGVGEGAEVLMGKRASGHAFMPDKYVFPGGRVDPEDSGLAAADCLRAEEAHLLEIDALLPARAYALAAIRETYEETGLFVAAKSAIAGAHPAFAARGLAPTLAPLRFIARAVTPPARSRRFDARFFLGAAEDCLCSDCAPADTAELSDLRWFTWEEGFALDLPSVTRFILEEVRQRLAGVPLRPVYLRWSPQGHRTDRM